MRRVPRVVLDTNVLVAALRSRRGASFEIISALGREEFEISISVSLLFEYEAVLARQVEDSPVTREDVTALIDYICEIALAQEIFFLWRPFLRDPGDDMVLELAVAAAGDAVVTHNVRDFQGAEKFGIRVITPKQFLQELRG